jgi:hypothetical protein
MVISEFQGGRAFARTLDIEAKPRGSEEHQE